MIFPYISVSDPNLKSRLNGIYDLSYHELQLFQRHVQELLEYREYQLKYTESRLKISILAAEK